MKKYLLSLVLLVLSTVTFAAAPADQLTGLLGNLKSMQAQFKQTIYDGTGGVIQHSSGNMALERPGKFLWQIKTPNAQSIIADGKNIWNYDPGLQQATQQPMGSSLSDTPAFLLTGSTTQIANTFDITQATSKTAGEVAYKLTPKDKGALFQWVQLSFKNDQLTQMQLQDNLGQQTVIAFSSIQFNKNLNPRLFQFTPPKGIDVIRS